MAKTAPAIEGVVTSVNGVGRKKYVVTRITTSSEPKLPVDTTVTFSMSEYEGDHEPKNGQLVHLYDVVKFTKGWRARLVTPICA